MPSPSCPGQNRRYWTPDDICTVPCPDCEYEVELFKDEGKRRCPRCGNTVYNPRVLQSCAAWCAYADACVGEIPDADGTKKKPVGTDGQTGNGRSGLAASLIRFLSGYGRCSRDEIDLLYKAEREAEQKGLNSPYSAAAVKVVFILYSFLSLEKGPDAGQVAAALHDRIPADIAEEACRAASGFSGPRRKLTDLQALLRRL